MNFALTKTILGLLLVLLTASRCASFTSPNFGVLNNHHIASSHELHAMADEEQKRKLEALGFSEDEVERSLMDSADSGEGEQKVRVDLIEEVDAATLTAVGFGLIAVNFFIFANMGDGGIGGLVATIMNTWDN